MPPLPAPRQLCQRFIELAGLQTFKGPVISIDNQEAYCDFMQDVLLGLDEWSRIGGEELPKECLMFHIARSDLLLNFMQFGLCQVQLGAAFKLSPE